MPAAFGQDRSHVFGDDRHGEEAGRALPTHIQRQLDAQLDTIGRAAGYYRSWPESHRQMMFSTAYTLLRDTGRRTSEVSSLRLDCLTSDANGHILIYDNHKCRRLNRRLPINESTAQAIRQWITVRSSVSISPKSEGYLFPGSSPRHNHLTTDAVSGMLRDRVRGLDRLDSNEFGEDGEQVPYDRSLILPYAFRHSYAQRHADKGTPIDVLRDLMDHRSIATTSGYYVVTADRKRSAIKTVGKYSVDRAGATTPLTQSTRYQMRSVAVPFGICVEPSNVKAGGHACPTRFQCAGCGFYRPDPSYIPAIEEHLNSLKADRETAKAMDSAPFVIDNLTAQISAFDQVLKVMRENLQQLDADERARVESAAALLRKARAGTPLPLTVVSEKKSETADDDD